MSEKIFISYSRKDHALLDQLLIHLSPYDLEIWTDREIESGELWRTKIDEALQGLSSAILLVTPDFLASDFIRKIELPHFLEEKERCGFKLHWILWRECAYEETPLKHIQCLNSNFEVPLASLDRASLDQALKNICRKIGGRAQPSKSPEALHPPPAEPLVHQAAKKGTWSRMKWLVLGFLVLGIGLTTLRFTIGQPNLQVTSTQTADFLDLEFQVQDDRQTKLGTNGARVGTGDQVHLVIQVHDACELLVFGLDTNGYHGIEPYGDTSKPVKSGPVKPLKFYLDNALGKETYFAVASKKKFNFEDDIKQYIRRGPLKGGAKDPSPPPEFHLELPESFGYESIHFNHVAAGDK